MQRATSNSSKMEQAAPLTHSKPCLRRKRNSWHGNTKTLPLRPSKETIRLKGFIIGEKDTISSAERNGRTPSASPSMTTLRRWSTGQRMPQVSGVRAILRVEGRDGARRKAVGEDSSGGSSGTEEQVMSRRRKR